MSRSSEEPCRCMAKRLPQSSPSNDGINSADQEAWSGKGVSLPNGTKLRMSYNGQAYGGEITKGAWEVEGSIYRTPSAAAVGVVKSKTGARVSLSGWGFWEVKTPDSDRWIPLNEIRFLNRQ